MAARYSTDRGIIVVSARRPARRGLESGRRAGEQPTDPRELWPERRGRRIRTAVVSRATALLALRIAMLAGLSASAALTVEYRSAGSAFCGPESGCAALRETDLAYLWGAGITLPELGSAGLLLALAMSLRPDATWGARLAVAGGGVGLVLLLVQAFALKMFCWLCVTTDVSSLIAGGFGLVALSKPRELNERAPLRLGAWVGLAVLALAAPLAWPQFQPAPPVPSEIRDFYRPDKINVIEFADFECPFCRRLHGQLKELLRPYGDRVHLVRLNAPLVRHPNAFHSAMAAICTESSAKAGEMVEFLFTTPDLSKPAIERHVGSLGLDTVAFERCLASPSTRERVLREREILDDIGFEGLPTTYVGDTRIVGARAPEVFRDAIERAASGSGERGVPAWAYRMIVLAVAAAIVRLGWIGAAARSTSPAAVRA